MSRCQESLVVTVILCLGGLSGVLGEPSASWWDRHKESISCVRPGYFVNPADCHSFYRCVDRSTWKKPALQRYDFTCPSGMVFDEAFSVCTKPGKNGCADDWWPGRVGGSGKGASNTFSRPAETDGQSEGNSLERQPSLFSSNNSPGGGSRSGSGQNGLGDPFGGDPLDTDFGSPSLDSSTKPSSGASLGLFSAQDRGPFGGNGGRDPLDSDFGSSGKPSSESGGNFNDALSFGRTPGGSRTGSSNPFGNSNMGGGGDPLDSDFGSSPIDLGPEPARKFNEVPPFLRNQGRKPDSGGGFGSGASGDPLDSDFGASPGSSGAEPARKFNEIPPFLRDTARKPNSGGGFGSGKGSDPLDSEFGRDSGAEAAKKLDEVPPFLKDRGQPDSGDFFGIGEGGNDPIDAEFRTPSSSSSSSKENPNRSKDNSGGSAELGKCRENCDENQSGQQGSRPSKSGGNDWWGAKNELPSIWDRSSGNSQNSIEFDNWDISTSPQTGNKPGNANWGGSSRPSDPTLRGESPWRPGGPWGSGSSNDIGNGPSSSIPQSPPSNSQSRPPPPYPESPTPPPFTQLRPPPLYPESPPPPSFSQRPPPPPPPNRPSWWDPPYALPYRPNGPSPAPSYPTPPPDWTVPYRPRYPTYRIVSYPTWPGRPSPYNRSPRPILIVYSNSKK